MWKRRWRGDSSTPPLQAPRGSARPAAPVGLSTHSTRTRHRIADEPRRPGPPRRGRPPRRAPCGTSSAKRSRLPARPRLDSPPRTPARRGSSNVAHAPLSPALVVLLEGAHRPLTRTTCLSRPTWSICRIRRSEPRSSRCGQLASSRCCATTPRDHTVPEATIIIDYLARHHPGKIALVPSDLDRARHTRLRDRFYDLYVHEPMQKIVGDKIRPAGTQDPYGVEQARARISTAYGMIEQDLTTGGPWAMGDGRGAHHGRLRGFADPGSREPRSAARRTAWAGEAVSGEADRATGVCSGVEGGGALFCDVSGIDRARSGAVVFVDARGLLLGAAVGPPTAPHSVRERQHLSVPRAIDSDVMPDTRRSPSR